LKGVWFQPLNLSKVKNWFQFLFVCNLTCNRYSAGLSGMPGMGGMVGLYKLNPVDP
jgi:hypothetical protein